MINLPYNINMTMNEMTTKIDSFIDANNRPLRKLLDSFIDSIDDFIIDRIDISDDLAKYDDISDETLEFRDMLDVRIRRMLINFDSK